jgi:hypothetical protein
VRYVAASGPGVVGGVAPAVVAEARPGPRAPPTAPAAVATPALRSSDLREKASSIA